MAPVNAVCIVQSEIALLSTALRCNIRQNYRTYKEETKNSLLKSLLQLKYNLNVVSSLNELAPLDYLSPFLEVIRSEDTTGLVTGLALTSVEKFLSYGLLELPVGDQVPESGTGSLQAVALAAEAIADAGTQARFVGTDHASDEVVLMKVLHVFRTLLLVPVGTLVSDRAVREILQSCFRICFEPKLSELLRRTAELCLSSMIQLFFSRLPFLLMTVSTKPTRDHPCKSVVTCTPVVDAVYDVFMESGNDSNIEGPFAHSTTPDVAEECVSVTAETSDKTTLLHPYSSGDTDNFAQLNDNCESSDAIGNLQDDSLPARPESDQKSSEQLKASSVSAIIDSSPLQQPSEVKLENPKNSPDTENLSKTTTAGPQPYGLPAIHDLLQYLIGLLAPENHTTNVDTVVMVALGLVTIALETGSESIAKCRALVQLVRGDLTKHLLLLLYSDRVWLFAAVLRVCFMLFESMRDQLKLQMEVYLQRLIAICSPENERTGVERREIALDSLVRLFFIPGLVYELYVNYDCDPYCFNLFEELVKMLTKNLYPIDRVIGQHLLALDALLVILCSLGSDANTRGCKSALSPLQKSLDDLQTPQYQYGHRHHDYSFVLPSRAQLNEARSKKKLLIRGSEEFNEKAKRGIAYLQQHGLLHDPVDADQLARFLRENPRLNKRMIGEYLSDRSNEQVLAAFVKQFNFANVSIDEALRVYLEAFRLPGEAPLIHRLMEHFAAHWHCANQEPFADNDSAFTLSYAILMLNTDQHNPNSKKQNVPMRVDQFKKNLSGMNGTGDFDPQLLNSIFDNIRKHEIIMPCEQSGLVRENYLWKCLLHRAESTDIRFIYVPPNIGTELDADLFELIWAPAVPALSCMFDKTTDASVQGQVVDGFIRCASIAALYGMCAVLDNLVIALCKFTTLLAPADTPLGLPTSFGRNVKARLALRLVFSLSSRHADVLRYSWHSLLDCLLQLFLSSLIPTELVVADDFLSASRRVRITPNGCIPVPLTHTTGATGNTGEHAINRGESSVFSSVYQYFMTGSVWSGSGGEEETCEDTIHTLTQDASSLGEASERPLSGKTKADLDGVLDTSRHSTKSSFDQLTSTDEHEFWTRTMMTMSAATLSQLDDSSAARLAADTVKRCGIQQLIEDSKFLIRDSLIELIKALLRAIRGDPYGSLPEFIDPSAVNIAPSSLSSETDPKFNLDETTKSIDQGHSSSPTLSVVPPRVASVPDASLGSTHYPSFNISTGLLTDNCRIFCTELLIRVLLRNRDRLSSLWTLVQCYLVDMLINAPSPSLLFERIVVGFLRLATCLLRRHELPSQIFTCLHYVLLTRGHQLLVNHPPSQTDTPTRTPHKVSYRARQRSSYNRDSRLGTLPGDTFASSGSSIGCQVIAGLTDLLRNHAADLPDPDSDWQSIFGLLEVCGAGLRSPSTVDSCRSSADDTLGRHCTSMNNIDIVQSSPESSRNASPHLPRSRSCINDTHTTSSSTDDCPHSIAHLTHPTEGHCPPTTSSTESWIVINCSNADANTATAATTTTSVMTIAVSENLATEQRALGVVDETNESTKPEVDAISGSSKSSYDVDLHHLIPSDLLRLPVFLDESRDSVSLERAADCLAFLIRDPAHISPDNFNHCARALRVFVESCLWCRSNTSPTQPSSQLDNFSARTHVGRMQPHGLSTVQRENMIHRPRHEVVALNRTTGLVAVQLLDLIDILFTRATSIYTEWNQLSQSESGAIVSDDNSDGKNECTEQQPDIDNLWSNCWLPLLQATCRLCCDRRRDIRTDALAFLQRQVLSPVLKPLSGYQWMDCFNKVLFPLLSAILEGIAFEEALLASQSQASGADVAANQVSRVGQTSTYLPSTEFADPCMRVIPLLTKVFLQNLRPLHQSEGFYRLWMRTLVYMEHYMQASSSDSLTDAVRESLKNVLLVMYTGTHDTAPILCRDANPETPEARFWQLTANQLSQFLPDLLDQLFPSPDLTTAQVSFSSIENAAQLIDTITTTHAPTADLAPCTSDTAATNQSDNTMGVESPLPSNPSTCTIVPSPTDNRNMGSSVKEL